MTALVMRRWLRSWRQTRLTRKKQRQLSTMAALAFIICMGLFYLSSQPAESSTLHPLNFEATTNRPTRKYVPLALKQGNDRDSWRNWELFKALSKSLGLGKSDFDPVPSVDCRSAPQSDLPFCNTNIPFMTRAVDLVSRMTTTEKIDQTSTIAPGITRLGIKDYNWRSNCVHGWTASGGHWLKDLTWTVFPAPIGLGATFDPDIVNKVGQVTSDEGRALHNEMMAANNGSSTEAAGLNCFSPNVNLFRDPRWGRGEETYGEDPYVLSIIGAAYTRGLQEGDTKNYLKVAACAKHFAVHSGPDNIRSHFQANTSLHDLYDTYLPAFKSQVMAANVAQIMPAYSGMRCKYQKDGAPDAANPFLLKTVLRQQFGAPNISICSDNGGVSQAASTQKYVPTAELAAAVCMNATTDLDLGHDETYTKNLQNALDDKLVTLQSITDAVVRNFYLRMMLGDFDPPSMVPYQLIDKSHLDTPQNQALNLQAARESIVLLKNLVNSLPLDPKSIKNLAVIGPNANATHVLLSNYEGIPSKVVSVLEGIEQELSGESISVNYAPGCTNVKCEDQSKFQDALNIVHSADYVVMVMGLDGSVEGEGHDRAETECNGVSNDVLGLPGCQSELVQHVVALNSRVILVLINGGPLSLAHLHDERGIIGIIEAFYPGALGGTAVADVLFGNYNPGGRMPVTTYLSADELPSAVDYNMTMPPGRTYRYYTGTPLFPFGYGLSYTTFDYSKLMVTPSKISACDSVKVTVSVQNSGEMAGDEVIQIYLAPPKRPDKPFFPNIQLVGFERVNIKPEVVHMSAFELNPYLLSLVDEDGEHYIFPGDYTVISSNQPEEEVIKATFTITGTAPVKTTMCTSSPQCLAC